jgi:hypothetical protein
MHRHFRLPALAALFLSGAFSVWAADTPVKGGTLIYLEQQPHTNLYPPAGGFIQRRHSQSDNRQADLAEPENAGD